MDTFIGWMEIYPTRTETSELTEFLPKEIIPRLGLLNPI
jgi:hypothetical protein